MMNEGELLQTLLSQLTPEQSFMLGEVMGIATKVDRERIKALERAVKRLEENNFRLRETIQNHQIANEEEEGGDGQG
jgi:hypothetical protein